MESWEGAELCDWLAKLWGPGQLRWEKLVKTEPIFKMLPDLKEQSSNPRCHVPGLLSLQILLLRPESRTFLTWWRY